MLGSARLPARTGANARNRGPARTASAIDRRIVAGRSQIVARAAIAPGLIQTNRSSAEALSPACRSVALAGSRPGCMTLRREPHATNMAELDDRARARGLRK